MNDMYGEQHRALQQRFDSTQLADRVKDIIVQAEIPDEHKAFIESRDMFFFTTIDHRGFPTCSYKGGAPGFVKVVDNKTIVFPDYDGNGMFLSMGNLTANDKIGMLFIDFETPHRIRVHGIAKLIKEDDLMAEFVGARLLVQVTVTEIFINCPRYIHQYQRLKTSKYAPQANCKMPPAPQWKRIDAIQDALPEHDKNTAAQLGGTITPEEYAALLLKGEG
jgi:predicted pyridoxine 5'-phosphate oxidase superfamily flavin-nucleotide-binding protein